MALQSDGETSEKRLCTDEEGNQQGDATAGLALGCNGAKRSPAEVGVADQQDDAEAAAEVGFVDQQGDAAAAAEVGVVDQQADADAEAEAEAEAAEEVGVVDQQGGAEAADEVGVVDQQGGAAAAAALGYDGNDSVKRLRLPGGHISALPIELKQSILAIIPLRSAMRMEAQSGEWRHLWKNQDREHPSSLVYDLVGRAGRTPQNLLKLLKERAQEHRLLRRFSLVVAKSTMRCGVFKKCLRLLAKCVVEDLHIELRKPTNLDKVLFHFPLISSSPRLARLSLRGVSFSGIHLRDDKLNPPTFSTLEVMQLDDVWIDDLILGRVLRLCPDLRVLDLRDCDVLANIDMVNNPWLTRLTVKDCDNVSRINIVTLSGLRSFHYTGSFLSSLYLPRGASFTDLSICCDLPIRFNDLFDNSLLTTSQLSVLTICSNTLELLCSLSGTGAHAELNELTELQLVMFDMESVNVSDIYEFLNNYRCPKLKRLFVKLPADGDGDDDNFITVPPEIDLQNLEVVKIVNSNCNLGQLVSFLLKKAGSLRRLLLVSPNGFEPLDAATPQEDSLLLWEAVLNGTIILGDDDDDATQPFHSKF